MDEVGLVSHALLDVWTLSLVSVLTYLLGCKALDADAVGVVHVVLSGDGFGSSSRNGAVAVSARVLGMDPWWRQHGYTSMDSVFTLAYFAGSESSLTVHTHALEKGLDQAAKGFDVGGTSVRVKITLCADGKWLSNALGLAGGNAKMGCPWCATVTQESCDDEYVQRLPRCYNGPFFCHYLCRPGCQGAISAKTFQTAPASTGSRMWLPSPTSLITAPTLYRISCT